MYNQQDTLLAYVSSISQFLSLNFNPLIFSFFIRIPHFVIFSLDYHVAKPSLLIQNPTTSLR